MIVWLASYPKSGNTFVRSLLSSYIFSKDGNFNFELLKEIQQFPDNSLFKQLGVDTENEDEMYKNYINSQKLFNDKDSIRFLKTNSCFVNTNKFRFTDRHNTLGVIYIVRDPRNVVTSFSHHFQLQSEQALESLLSHRYIGQTSKYHCTTYIASWKYHFNSWKVFRRFNKYLLVRYEDLILKTTGFDYMQKLEAKESFAEAKTDKKTGKKIKFFNMGIKNDWKNLLDKKIKENLEKELENEMRELNYL